VAGGESLPGFWTLDWSLERTSSAGSYIKNDGLARFDRCLESGIAMKPDGNKKQDGSNEINMDAKNHECG
jgi:hypothetical protein